MSYQVLARKWRPRHFRDMLGQEPVLRALISALDGDRLHHAYLFTGTRGVGKTTVARIFAKCLNCETRGVSSDPCGDCGACRAVDEGRFLDLIEVDAASRTKVDETRELLENVPYAPAGGRYKVYLIDEVHMFSTHSFNALLKTLEEPPGHVKFLLATTDPQKVPVTVLSRCLQFNLRRIGGARLADYLARLLDSEGVAHERAALELVARAAEGSVRDALSLVEQAVAFGEGEVRADAVEAMLGRVSTGRLLELLDALGRDDLAGLHARVDALAEHAPDFGELLAEILSLLHRVALLQSLPGGAAETEEDAALAALARALAPEDVQLWYQIGLHARRDLPFAPDPREAFDMALLRMSAFRPQPREERPTAASKPAPATSAASGRDSAAGPAAAPAVPSRASATPAAATAPDTAVSVAGPTAVAPATDARASALAAVRGGARGRSAAGGQETAPAALRTVVSAAATVPASTPTPPSAAAVDPAAAAGAGDSSVMLAAGRWPELVETLGLSGMPRQLAAHCALLEHGAERVVLGLERDAEHMNAPRFVERLRVALVAVTGRELALEIRLLDAEGAPETPAQLAARREHDVLAEARRALDEDRVLRTLVDGVDGSLDPAQVRPVESLTDTHSGE